MTMVFLSPLGSSKSNFRYTFKDGLVLVECEGIEDVFDFRQFPDGKLEVELIETKFEINPLVSAEKRNGILYLTLLNRIGSNATYEERFPEWIDAKDYVFKEVDNGEAELEE